MEDYTDIGHITWHECRKTGEGVLTLSMDDGTEERLPWDGDPIGRTTDSQHIAGLFGGWEIVEHNGDVIHVANPAD